MKLSERSRKRSFTALALACALCAGTFAFACGPEPMLKAVYNSVKDGQFSFEARMGCGFGACMGCSKKTKHGFKRVCKDGPIFTWEEIAW